MRYLSVVDFYQKIEATTKRLEMTDILVNLFRKTPADVIDKLVYLTQGILYPDFMGIELGMAEKLAARAISRSTGVQQDGVDEVIREKGDIGLAAEALLKNKKQSTFSKKELDVSDVYETLDRIARTSGPGSVDTKIKLLTGLLADCEPVEAKYIMRTVTGKMRLGMADMTILDALAIAFASKSDRPAIERAYNMTSDLGDIARTLVKEGIDGIKKYHAKVGRPIRMMLAQRMESAAEIIEKLGGGAVCEWKYDGERLQIHKNKNEVLLFSRRLENVTAQYPDIADLARKNILVDKAVLEGECVAVDPETSALRPFQELMNRRRKYDIKETIEKVPAHIFLFDVLISGDEDLTQKPLPYRKQVMNRIINQTNGFRLADSIVTDDVEKIEEFFESAIENGCEGLMLKSNSEDSVYQAGARGWLWIKLKRSYQSKMIEPIDCVIVGAYSGRGRRSGTYGALLVAVYDPERDVFPTICKLGSGFTDAELESLPKLLEPHRIENKHPRTDSTLDADVWFTPALVLEVIGDEYTLSPIHTCAYGRIRRNAGIAVRFPRFTRNWRRDKAPEDATNVEEIVEMYKNQLKTIAPIFPQTT